MVPTDRARAHLTELLKVPRAELRTICRLADIHENTARDLRARRLPSIRLRTEQRLLTLTVERLQKEIDQQRLPAARYRQLVRSMHVQGWSSRYQATQIGRRETWIVKIGSGAMCTVDTESARRLDALADRLSRQWGPSRASATKARNAGWYPLACYDDDGTLIPEAVRRDERILEREAQREKTAQAYLEAIRLTLEGIGPREISTRVPDFHGPSGERRVHRIRTDLGLRFTQEFTADGEQFFPLAEESEKKAAAIRLIVTDHDARCETETVDAWETVHYKLGLMNALRYTWDVPAEETETPVPEPAPVDLTDLENAA
jgi:hypothetical protein